MFDFTTGQTVLVDGITGGNPDLLADKRNVLKIRRQLEADGEDRPPACAPNMSARGWTGPCRASLASARRWRLPSRSASSAIRTGQLVSVDFRPVNYDEARRDTLRWGFDFSMPLKSARPSQAAMERFRARRAAETGQAGSAPGSGRSASRGWSSPEGAGPPPGGPGGGFGPGGGGGGFGGGGGGFGRFGGGGRQGGRLQFSLTHTVNLVDEVTIRDGLPKLDYLNGDAVGSTGGRSRHQVEAQGGYFNNGLGARVSANWRSGTRVDSSTGDDLHFSPLATFDLRLFANLGERFDLVAKHPWLRGSSVRLEVNNVFDSKPRVRNSAGDVPSSYQPDLLDPLGRTVSISIRKLFLPPRSFFRRQAAQSRD